MRLPDRPAPAARATDGWRLGRRQFLLGSGGVLLGTLVACSSDSNSSSPPSGDEADALPTDPAEALAAAGTTGLMDEATYQARVDAYLEQARATPNLESPTGLVVQLLAAQRDPDYTWDAASVGVDNLAKDWEKIDAWEDTRDFSLMYLIWLYQLSERGDSPTTTLDPAINAATKERLLANRYRYDDPLPDDRVDDQWFWSENHLIIGLALEILAGQMFPDDVFTVTGLTGAEHAERSRPDAMEWIHERAELGFFEWHSNVYMLKNITPLLMLAELSDDAEMVTAAAMALDLCLLDMAAHNQNGCYTAPRGRTYKKDKTSSLDEDTFGTAKFVFDDTTADYQSMTDNGVTYLCAATRYRPPQLVIDIATSDETSVVRERHGVYFDGSTPVSNSVEAPYGKDFADPANLEFWWSLGAVGMWPLAQVGIDTGNEYRLWEAKGFEEVGLMAALNDYDPERIAVWEQERSAVINFGFLSEANTYAYREPKVSLASVLDHRPGEMRDQVHAWQAAIDENAMVFTTHPVTEPDEDTDWSKDGKPGYWTGEASMPRSAQFERTGIHIYLPAWDEATDPLVWSVFGYRPFTHAYVPQDHFDAVEQRGNWTVVERSGAYIALWSWRTPTWREYDPAVYATNDMVKPFDLVAEGGADNVWIVEVGTTEADGDLDAFIASLTANEPEVERTDDGFTVAWTSPSAGEVTYGSTGPFTVDGEEQVQSDFPRHDSPWGTIDHNATTYELESANATWKTDFESLRREVG